MAPTVLGINPGIDTFPGNVEMGRHDPSACLIKDGKILAAAEEERFTRNKWGQGDTDQLPKNSIKFVLNYTDTINIDAVAIGWDPSNAFKKLKTKSKGSLVPTSTLDIKRPHEYAEKYYNFLKSFVAEYTSIREDNVKKSIRSEVDKILKSVLGTRFDGNIIYIPHHRSHAASAHYCSEFDQQVTITADGGGEHLTTVLWSNFNTVEQFIRPNSIGHFYSTGAEYLGYTRPSGNRHAGKVMGLAPYGSKRDDFEEIFDNLVQIKNGKYDVTEFVSKSPNELENYFGKKHAFPDSFDQHHKDFAHHLQKKLEEIVVNLVESLTSQTGIHNLSLAGGVFLNCKLNRELRSLDCVDNIFIQPAAHDGGVALGAALEAYNLLTNEYPIGKFDNIYFGSEYSDSNVEEILCRLKLDYDEIETPWKEAAEMLANEKLIGWFQGRMEFGPRALGNRSILANPKSVEARDQVNKYVKNREEWRPFAPSILHEAKDEYLIDGGESPYMILTDKIKDHKQNEIPAVVHVDGTARPQTVKKKQNKRYYKLISEFDRLTGVPVLLNTSFNVSGEPIVESPQQAVSDFYSTGLDALFINKFVIKK